MIDTKADNARCDALAAHLHALGVYLDSTGGVAMRGNRGAARQRLHAAAADMESATRRDAARLALRATTDRLDRRGQPIAPRATAEIIALLRGVASE